MTDTDTPPAAKLAPAPMHAALKARMLHAMLEAESDAGQNQQLEYSLRRLAPAPMHAPLRARLRTQLQQTARSSFCRPYAHRRVWHMAAAASIALLGICGLGTMLQAWQQDAETMGLVRRSVLERTGGDTVQWATDGAPVRQYEVMYEDSFILPGEDDTTLVIRVPNRTTIHVKGEVI